VDVTELWHRWHCVVFVVVTETVAVAMPVVVVVTMWNYCLSPAVSM